MTKLNLKMITMAGDAGLNRDQQISDKIYVRQRIHIHSSTLLNKPNTLKEVKTRQAYEVTEDDIEWYRKCE